MEDWNVVVSVRDDEYKRARGLLREFGPVGPTEFFNVLVMKVADIHAFVESLRERLALEPQQLECLGRVMPLTHCFVFQSAEEFEGKARETVMSWLPVLAGKTFHVRMHRRGFKGRLSGQDEERFFGHMLIERLKAEGAPGGISFDDPDVIVAVETVGQRAGLSLWSRAERNLYPFLRLD